MFHFYYWGIHIYWSLINNRKDYIKIDEDKIEFFNSACYTDEDSSNEIDEFNSIKNENVINVEFQFEIDDDVKSFESIKFILKNKKEVVMDLEEMSLSSYDNVIQNEISSRFKGLISESSTLMKNNSYIYKKKTMRFLIKYGIVLLSIITLPVIILKTITPCYRL